MWIDNQNLDEYLENVDYDGLVPEDIEIENRTNLYWRFLGKMEGISYIILKDNDGKIILSLDKKESQYKEEMNKILLTIIEKENLTESVTNEYGEVDNSLIEFRIGDIKDIQDIIESLELEDSLISYEIDIPYNSLLYNNFLEYKRRDSGYIVIGGVITSSLEGNILEDYSYDMINPIIKIPESDSSVYVGEDVTMVIEESINGSPQMVFYNNDLRR